jgi:hypothetical protein
MRRLLVLSVAGLMVFAGCGGNGGGGRGKKEQSLTRAQYAAALDKLCIGANQEVAALKLTQSPKTWKKNGERAAKIAADTVVRFKALEPPVGVRDLARRFNDANDRIVAAVKDAADAAKAGDKQEFAAALQRNFAASRVSKTAASQIGAVRCA